MTPEHILITGVSGSVGVETVRWLFARAPECRLSGLLRASSDADLEMRWSKLLRDAGLDERARASIDSRWKPVRGDITARNFGLDSRNATELMRDVTHIVHAAADVRFTAPLDESRLVNTIGTRNALEFGVRCKRLERFAHVSTCFVAGRRTGRILEEELQHDEGFVSHYERTKHEAEIDARTHMRDMPIAIYRLGLLPGRARDGYVHQFGAFHRLLYYYDKGVLEMVPGALGSLLDVSPTDWAADVLMQLYFEHFEAGRTYQVCSGGDAVSVADFAALTYRHFSEHRVGRRLLQPLRVVDADVFTRFMERIAAEGTESAARMVGVMSTTAPHAILGKVFDRSAVEACLGARARAPLLSEYYGRIVEHCMRTDWGRAPKLSV
jgi:nucleoside-diphosphate-sugar epimerase